MPKASLLNIGKAGFSLMELMLVVAIITTLGVFSTGFFSNFLLHNTVANTQDQIIEQLRKAQIYAMSGKEDSPWSVHYEANQLTLYKGNVFSSRTQSFDEVFKYNSSVTIANLTDITFTQTTGLPSATPTISISGGGKTKTVTINSQGVASR